MIKLRSVLLVLIGIGVGCATHAAIPSAMISSSQAASGWRCYVVDRFPDPGEASAWKGAQDIASGMSAVAGDTPTGTVIAVTPKSGGGSYASVVCVKD